MAFGGRVSNSVSIVYIFDLISIQKFSIFALRQFIFLKKVIAISLVFIFLISTLGLSVVISYCPMKEGYSFSLREHKSCCGDSRKNDCCKTSKLSFNKIEDNFIASSYHFNTPQFDIISCTSQPSVSFSTVHSKKITYYQNLPPPKTAVPLNILYRSILI